jgi:hypothetical protein
MGHRRRLSRLTLALLLIVTHLPAAALADWPVNGRPVSTYFDSEFWPHIGSDDTGGVFAGWWSGSTHAQHITGAGEYADSWPAAGFLVPPAEAGYLEHYRVTPLAVVPDGEGGAYFVLLAGATCQAECGGDPGQFYVQRLTAAGTVASGWPQGGVRAETWYMNFTHAFKPISAVRDGNRGILIAWATSWYPAPHPTIGVQSISSDGKCRWGENGLTIAQVYSDLTDPTMTSDGEAGAYVFWGATRSLGENRRIYGQHVSAAGEMLWPANGAAISESSYTEIGQPVACSDGADRSIVAWSGSHGAGFDIYAAPVPRANRVSKKDAAEEVVAEHRPEIGRLQQPDDDDHALRDDARVCAAPGDQTDVRMIGLRHGGAILTWLDSRALGLVGIYAQRMTSRCRPLWLRDGAPVCTAPGTREFPAIASDGEDGAYIAWGDSRSADELYAMHMTGDGAPAHRWPLDGAAVCARSSTGGLGVEAVEMTSVPDRRAIVVWEDYRQGTRGDQDLAFVMLLTPNGPAAVPAGVASSGSIETAAPGRAETLSQPALSLRANGPSSASGDVVIHFSLPNSTPARLDMFDLSGRRIWTGDLALASGAHALTLPKDMRLAPGLYFARLTQAGLSATARVVLVR